MKFKNKFLIVFLRFGLALTFSVKICCANNFKFDNGNLLVFYKAN